MSDARSRLTQWMAGRNGDIIRAQTEGDDDPLTTPPVDLSEPDQEPEPPRLEPAQFPGRLGDRRPEFRKLSDKVAEANRRAREHGGRR